VIYLQPKFGQSQISEIQKAVICSFTKRVGKNWEVGIFHGEAISHSTIKLGKIMSKIRISQVKTPELVFGI
jgi:hypothetical protein